MKKTLLISLAFVVTQITASAQKTKFGFTAGVVASNYHIKTSDTSIDLRAKAGISIGVIACIPLAKHIQFQPALNFLQKGASNNMTYNGITETYKLNINYLEIPLNLLYNSNGENGNFFIGAGPSFAIALSGKIKTTVGDQTKSENIKFGNEDDSEMKKMDVGVTFATGYSFNNGVMFSLNYHAGITNLFPGSSDDATLKNDYFGLRIGYLFNQK